MLPSILFLIWGDVALAFPKLPGSNLLPWKRDVVEERQADAQPTCSCNTVDPAAAAFVGHLPFAAAASAAPTPQGYVNVFTNEYTYCSAEGGLGFTVLDTYESELCATLCESVEGCAAFTLYYEKDASNYRGTDVQSSAVIKCAFWAGSLSPSGSSGRASEAYNAIIAGSNGYTNEIITVSEDFGSAGYLGGAAIDCPEGSAEAESFIRSKNVGTGAFDANLCVDLCHSVSCQFFNTYVLNKNGESVGQYCDLYTAPVPASYATNVGKRDGKHNYTISSSYTFANDPFNHDEREAMSSVARTASLSVSASLHPHPHQSSPTASSSSSGWSRPQSGHGGPQGVVSPTTSSSASSTSSSPHDPSKAASTTSSQSLSSTAAPRSSTSANGGHSRNSSRTSDQSTVVIFSTQTLIPLPVTQSTRSSKARTYTDSQTLSLTSSPSNSSSMTHDLSQTPGGPTYYSTTSSSSDPSPTPILTSPPAHPTMSSSSTTLGIDPVNPSTSTSPTPDTDPAYPSTSVSPTSSPSPQSSSTSTHPTSDTDTVRPLTSVRPTSSLNPQSPSTSTHPTSDTDTVRPSTSVSPISSPSPHSPSTSTSPALDTDLAYPSTSVSPTSSPSSQSSSTSTHPISDTDLVRPSTSVSPTSSSSPRRPSTTLPGTYTHSMTTTSQVRSTSNHPRPYGSSSSSSSSSGRLYLMSTSSMSNTSPWSSGSRTAAPSSEPSLSSSEPGLSSSASSVVIDPAEIAETTRSTTEIPTPTDVTSSSNTTGNYTGSPSGYKFTGVPLNMSHMSYSPGNNSWYCELTHQWYHANGNFSLAGFNFTDPYANTSVSTNTTSISILPTSTSTSTTSSVVADPTRISVNSTILSNSSLSNSSLSNSTSFPAGYNTSISFNMTHMIYSPSNSSWYCELTHQWYPANGNLSLSGFNFTLPSNNVTSNTTDLTTSSVVPDPKSTQSSSTSSLTAANPSSTASNSTSTTYSSYNSSGRLNMTNFNSSHLTYSASNNSIFCTITGLWYPAGNFSLASLNLTGNYTVNPNYSLNYTTLSNTTNSAITPVLPSSTSASSEVPSSTPAPDNTIMPLNTTGIAYPSYNYSIPFNASHMIYSPSNNSFYCELTHLWYPAGNVSNIPGFNMSAYLIFNGTLPSYNYTLVSNTTNTTSTSATSSTSQTPTATPSPENSTTETNATSGYNSTGIFPPSFNASASNSSHLHFAANGSMYCDITQRWYLPNDTSWLSLLNSTYPSFSASAYGSNSTHGTNSTSTNTTVAGNPTAPTIGGIPGNASAFYVTVNAASALRRRNIEYLGFSGSESVIVESSSQASQLYIVNGFMLDVGNGEYVGTDSTGGSVIVQEIADSAKALDNWEVFGSTLSLKGATFCYTADKTLFVVSLDVSSPEGCTTVVLGSIPVSSATSTSSGTPIPTPAPSGNSTFTNSTGVFPTYNTTYSVPSFNGSTLNSSHLIYAANGSVYCDITQKWYLSNDTSWTALLNSTYPSFNASAYGGYNRTSYSLNSTLTNTTDLNATSTSSSSSILDTPTPTTAPDLSSNATSSNSAGIYPQYNSTVPAFNASALNSTDHLTYYANGSVFCDYTQKLYAANDTSWTSLMNYTSSGYNSSAYAGFNSTASSQNSTGVNATSTTSSNVEPTATATSEPVANVTASTTNSTAMTNSTGVFPQYNTTISSFNASVVNSTDHLIFYANGSVWCDYTQELYPANDTSWMSLLNETRSGFNTSAYGGLNPTGFNSTGYSYNTTSLNSTTHIANATSTNLTTPADPADSSTPTPTPDPVANSTDSVTNSTDTVSNTTIPSNSTGISPSYNGTLSSQFNSSVLKSTDHLIFYANGSVFCDYTQQLYPANDTSWMNAGYSSLNSTGSSYNATRGFNTTNYSSSYNATTLNSTTPVGNSTTAEPSPISTMPSNSDTPASLSNSTAPSNATTSNNTGVFPSSNTSTVINSTNHLIFFSNGSVYCEDTQQLYPANDTSWLNPNVTSSYAYTMLNSTAPGYYAPTNLTAAGLGYSDASLNSTGGDGPTPSSSNIPPAAAASSTGYMPPTYGNGTMVDGNSTTTEAGESTGPERKVRRWKAPRERAGMR